MTGVVVGADEGADDGADEGVVMTGVVVETTDGMV